MTNMCKEVIKELKLECIGKRLEPPLLLTSGLEETISEEKERGECKKFKKVVGYVSKGEPTMPENKTTSILREKPLISRTKVSFLEQGCKIILVGGSDEHK